MDEAIAEEVENYHQWDMVILKNGRVLRRSNQATKRRRDRGFDYADKEDGKQYAFPAPRSTNVQYKGRPILVGTVSIEKSEIISNAAGTARNQARSV